MNIASHALRQKYLIAILGIFITFCRLTQRQKNLPVEREFSQYRRNIKFSNNNIQLPPWFEFTARTYYAWLIFCMLGVSIRTKFMLSYCVSTVHGNTRMLSHSWKQNRISILSCHKICVFFFAVGLVVSHSPYLMVIIVCNVIMKCIQCFPTTELSFSMLPVGDSLLNKTT